jgi:hypothetical protein
MLCAGMAQSKLSAAVGVGLWRFHVGGHDAVYLLFVSLLLLP